MQNALRWWASGLLKSVFVFSEAQGTFLAAGLCYFVLFSLFPLLLVLVAVAAHFVDQAATLVHIQRFVHQALPSQEAQVMGVLQTALANRGGASLLGALVLWWAAKGAFSAATTSLNLVWNSPYPRPFLEETWRSLLLAATAGAAILVSGLGLTALSALASWELPSLGWSPSQMPWVAILMGQLLPALGGLGCFWALYRHLPAIDTSWWAQWPGALAASLLWELMRRGFGWYLDGYGRYDLVYGPLAGMIGFMFWVYLTGIVFLWGACLNRALRDTAYLRRG